MLQFRWWFTKIFVRKSTKKILNVWKLTNTGVIVDIICEHNLYLGERRFNDKWLNILIWPSSVVDPEERPGGSAHPYF